MSVISVWAPAEVIQVRAELGAPDGAGVMETLVMRALREGMTSISQLTDLVGTTPRLMLDLVTDLWRSGWITVDVGTEREEIHLARAGVDLLDEIGPNADAPGAGATTHTIEVLLEKLTGRVLPGQDGRARGIDRQLRVPPLSDDRAANDVRGHELGTAIELTLRRNEDEADRWAGRPVLQAHIVPTGTQRSVGLRFVEIAIDVVLEAGALRVQVVDERLSLEQRELATRRLDGAVAAAPRSRFARALRESQPKGMRASLGSITTRAEDLRRSLSVLADATPSTRQSKHSTITSQAELLLNAAEDRAEREMTTRVLRTKEEHDDEILGLIRATRRQLVLALPWVREQGLLTFETALIDAAARGVSIVLLWGAAKEGENLDGAAAQLLIDMRRSARQAGNGGQILYHRDLSSHSHAKVVISDDRRAVVTSRNYFSQKGGGETGVSVTAAVGRPSRVIEELLHWATTIAPSSELMQTIVQRGDELGLARPDDVTPEDLRNREPLLPDLNLPRWDPRLAEDRSTTEPVVALWLQDWSETVEAVIARVHRPQPVVSVISDSDHRSALLDALSGARARILVTSHRLSSHAVTGDLVRRAREATGRTPNTRLIYGALSEAADLNVVTTLRGEGVDVQHRAQEHSKVIIADDVTYVGSYNYLSFDGSFRFGRFSAELSLRIESRSFADEVASQFGLDSPSANPVPENTHHEPMAAAAGAARVLESLLSESLPADDTMDAIVRVLADVDTDAVLAALEVGDPRTRERVLATVIARTQDLADGDGVTLNERRRALVQALWTRAEWQGASLADLAMRGSLSAENAVLAVAAANRDVLVGVVTEAAVLDDLPDDDVDAIAAHVIAELLAAPLLTDLAQASRVWLPRLGRHMDEVVDAGLAYWARYGGLQREQLLANATHDERMATLDAHWRRLKDAVADLRTYLPKNELGELVLAHMFGSSEEMGTLARIVDNRDFAALREWDASYRQPDDSRWINRATRRAGSTEMLDGRRRTSFMAKRLTVRKALSQLLDTTVGDPQERSAHDPEMLDAASTLASVASAAMHARVNDVGANATLSRDALGRILALVGRLPDRVDDRRAARFPRYWAATLHDEPDSPFDELLARDLIDVRRPEDSVMILLRDGEAELARLALDELDDSALVDTARLSSLRDAVLDAETELLGMVRLRREALLRSAERAGLSLEPEDVPSGANVRRAVDLDLAFAPAEARLHARIADAAEAIRNRLGGNQSLTVDRLLSEGDLLAASHAAEQGHPGDLWREVGRPTILSSYSAREIGAHLQSVRDRPRWLDPFVPWEDDEPGRRFVAALATLVPSDAESLRRYVRALHSLVSDRELTFFSAGQGETVSIDAPVPGWLQGLRHRRFVVAVGGNSRDAHFRISTGFGGGRADDPVLDLGQALMIMAGRSREERQIALLRFIGANLHMSALFDQDSFPVAAHRGGADLIRSLLHLRGLDPSPANVERLIEASGNHPAVLYRLISDFHSLEDPDGRVALELRPDIDELIWRAALYDDVGLPSAVAVLGIVAALGAAWGVDRSEIEEWVEIELGSSRDFATDLNLLLTERYLREDDGRVGLVNDAVGRALQRTVDAWLPSAIQNARADIALGPALDELRETRLADLEHANKQARDQLPPRLIRISQGDYWPTNQFDAWEITLRAVSEAAATDVPVIAVDLAGGGHQIDGHPNYLLLLLRNAIANAQTAARPGESPRVQVLLRREGNELVLDVDDNGPGFEAMQGIGEGRGYRAMSEYTRRLGGGWRRGIATGSPGHTGLGGGRVSFVLPRAAASTLSSEEPGLKVADRFPDAD